VRRNDELRFKGEDVLEPPSAHAERARFLWDRFLPEFGLYRWREQEDARRGGPAAAARAARLLGEPGAAVALERLARGRAPAQTRAWAAEAAALTDPVGAARRLAGALADEPRPAWRAWRAAALAAVGDETAAQDELARALEDAPDLRAARALRAILAARAHAPERALADLDEALARSPFPGLWSLRAELRWRADRRAEAVADAHAAVDAHPENLDGFVRLLYARRGARAAAERGAESALLLDEARRAAADAGDAAWGEAVLGALLGRGDRQLPSLRAAAERDPDRAWVRAFLGRALGDERTPGDRAANLKAAEAELAAAVKLAPRAGWIACWRAEVLKRLERREEALAALDAGLALDPDYKLGRAWRSELRMESGDLDGAEEDFEDCWRVLRRPAFLYRRSQSRRARGEAAGALADLAECARASAPHSFAFSPLPWLADAKRLAHEGPAGARGRAGFGLRSKLRALAKDAPWRGLREAPCRIPAPPPPWRPSDADLKAAGKTAAAEAFRGRALLDAGRETEALAALDRAARLEPGLHAARLWRGEARARLGRWSGARADFDAAAASAPRGPLPRLWQGLGAWHEARFAEAAELWAAAARLDAPNAHLVGWWLRAMGVPPRARRRRGKGSAAAPTAELELRLGAPARAAGLLRRERGPRADLLAGAAQAALGRAENALGPWRRALAAEPAEFTRALPLLLDGIPAVGSLGSAAAHLALSEAWNLLGRREDAAAARSVARGLLGPEAPRFLLEALAEAEGGAAALTPRKEGDILYPMRARANASVATGLDRRVELICALEAAAGANPCPQGEEPEALALARKAVPKRHEAVKLFQKMSAADWRHRHPSLVLLDLSDPPELVPLEQKDHYENAGREDAVARLLPALRDLAARPSLQEYLADAGARHAEAVAELRTAVESTDYLAPLEEYLGVPLPHEYRFIAAPLLHGPSPHNVLYARPPRALIYTICGHVNVRGGKPNFAHPVRDLRRTAWHEVCHTVVDGWTQARRAELEPFAPLYARMTGRARDQYQGPPGWLHMVDEHVIRAVVARLSARVEGADAGRAALAREKEEGFALIEPVHDLLAVYEKQRGRYRDLRALYPRLLEVLETARASGSPR